MSRNLMVVFRNIAVIATIMMLLSSSLMFPVSAASIPEPVEQRAIEVAPALVHIYYDQECLEARAMVMDTLNPLIKAGIIVEKFDISSLLQMDAELDRYHPDYAIYYFQSSQAGLLFRDATASWKDVAGVLALYPRIEHIFGVGSAFNIKDYLGEPANLHVDDSEVIDVRLGRLYALWTIADTMALSEK